MNTAAINQATAETIIGELRQLRGAVLDLCRTQGVRLTREQVCERLGIHRNTLRTYIARGDFPQPGRDGKWLLADVVDAECKRVGKR